MPNTYAAPSPDNWPVLRVGAQSATNITGTRGLICIHAYLLVGGRRGARSCILGRTAIVLRRNQLEKQGKWAMVEGRIRVESPRRVRGVWAIFLSGMMLLVTACGDGGSSTTTTSASMEAAGFPSSCPSTSESLDAQNSATYQVFGEIPIRLQDGSTGLHYIFFGTAWAVRDRLLVTNAHVVAAFDQAASQGVQLSDAVAVQSGTGEIIRLLRSLTHPDYNGLPITSPDVGLLTSQEVMPDFLTLAPADSVLGLGDEVQIVGFPGDVEQFITSRPGVNVPQATSLLGTISSRRSHNDAEAVSTESLDVYQHQAPTTPGTSGSSMVHCGLVAGVNNAGTIKLVVTPSPTQQGQFTIDRQAAASNNFGVHVKHIHEMIELFDANAVQGVALPVPAATTSASSGGQGQGSGQESGLAGTYGAAVSDAEAQHQFVFAIDAQGNISGRSEWPQTGTGTLTGTVSADGTFKITDDAPERLGFRRGVYEGRVAQDGSISGIYYEETQENMTWQFAGARQ